VRRVLVALAIVVFAHTVFAQPDDWSSSRQERQSAEREARREAREQAREAREEAREAARAARREAREMRGFERRNGGVHLRILKNYTLAAGAVANEPIVVVGGSATIDGRAEDDVVVIGGSLRVGPTGVVGGEATSVGGRVIVDPAGQVLGQVDETVVDWPSLDFGWGTVSDGWWAVASFGAMLGRLGMVLVVSLLITWIGPGWTGRIGVRVSDAPAASLFTGLATQLLFVPFVIVVSIILAVSIVGIPVLLLGMPLFLAGTALLWIAGFAGVVGRLGARLRGQASGYSMSPTLDLLTGFAVVSMLTVTAHVLALGPWWTTPTAVALNLTGTIVEWVVWTLGLGAAMTSYLARRSDAPPAIPIMPSPAPSTL
jgi:hypothetical protein